MASPLAGSITASTFAAKAAASSAVSSSIPCRAVSGIAQADVTTVGRDPSNDIVLKGGVLSLAGAIEYAPTFQAVDLTHATIRGYWKRGRAATDGE